ncbi:hypothetical protein BCON_0133g00260 [Botryotinia convoluta]|uniref:Uncharacterized protein n=1 Tax=Botryotinia convoluta TaxID=54673 RepID=A0A4Z1HV93_9HELO|nr:hypothetical protein BCON_0133g00260 [Botryotinia convoluta]
MCHYTIEACGKDHEVSKRRKCRNCSAWEEGIDSALCTYEAALEAGEVKREFFQSRYGGQFWTVDLVERIGVIFQAFPLPLADDICREIIKDMRAEDEKLCKEEAVESKEESSGHKRDLVNKNMEAISKTDEDEAPPRNAESSNQLHAKRPTCVESGSVEKAAKELAEAEDTVTKSKIVLGDIGPLELQDFERKAGPGILSHEIQKIANNQANQTNTKRVASTTKKQSLGGKSSGAPNIKHVSDYKIKSIPEPVIR